MKNIKFLLLATIFLLTFSQTAKAEKTEKNEEEVSVSYESIDSIPVALPECNRIKVKVKHEAFKHGNPRNLLLGQAFSLTNQCLITFSVPELSELGWYDVEANYEGAPKKHCKEYLMVTAEYGAPNQFDVIAESTLFVFNPDEDPTLEVCLSDRDVSCSMDKYVVDMNFIARESIGTKEWTDEWMRKPIGIKIYQSDGASMYGYNSFGYSGGGDKDYTFNYGEVYMSYRKRQDLLDKIADYNQYLSDKAKKEKWYQTMKDYWEDEDYDTFNFAKFIKDRQATFEPYPKSGGDGPYVEVTVSGHKIKTGIFTGEVPHVGSYISDTFLDDAYVNWAKNAFQSASMKEGILLDTHCYHLRNSEMGSVKIGESIYVPRWEFDFLISLIDYYS